MASIFKSNIRWSNLVPRSTNQKMFKAAVNVVILFYMKNYGRREACQESANKYMVDYYDLINFIDCRLDSGLKELHYQYFKILGEDYKKIEADENIVDELNMYIKSVYRGAMN